MLFAAINWHSCIFLLCAALTCGFAVGVLLATNVVRMAACLIVCLSSTAALFFLAGAEFLGAMQIMIYVGGTLVLLVFGVMLTAQASFISMKTAAGEWVIAAIVGGSFLFVLISAAVSVPGWRQPNVVAREIPVAEVQTATPLGLALLGIRTDENPADSVTRGVSGYLLPFEIVGMHLLIVLIGAAYLARAKRRRRDSPQTP